ncbi:MAG: 5-oxoprolinase subunit PxpB [Limnohabitans sp.]|nr:5-oxoprolinase subunit PxpB [Limnohabitans sp.]
MLTTITHLTENKILIRFSGDSLENLNSICNTLFSIFKNEEYYFIIDVIPSYNSVTIMYDNLKTKLFLEKNKSKDITSFIEDFIKKTNFNEKIENNTLLIKIPVYYNEGIDIQEMAAQKNCTVEDIINWHTEKIYQVYMLGFLPGFAYMGMVNNKLSTPRKATPRNEVKPGSVGVAGNQTGIYPLASPGGWNIIGQTPLKIFDVSKKQPCLLQPNNLVQFYAIDKTTFELLNEY